VAFLDVGGLVVLHGPVTLARPDAPGGSRLARAGPQPLRRPALGRPPGLGPGVPSTAAEHDDTVTALACPPADRAGRRPHREVGALVATIVLIGAACALPDPPPVLTGVPGPVAARITVPQLATRSAVQAAAFAAAADVGAPARPVSRRHPRRDRLGRNGGWYAAAARRPVPGSSRAADPGSATELYGKPVGRVLGDGQVILSATSAGLFELRRATSSRCAGGTTAAWPSAPASRRPPGSRRRSAAAARVATSRRARSASCARPASRSTATSPIRRS
jgi:hypothetical protein